MESMALQLIEPVCEDLPQQELLELTSAEMDQIGAGMCDPGIIIIEK
jgi:hypothetical protein